MEQQFVACSHK